MGSQNGKTSHPWLDEAGRELDSHQLKEITKSWDFQTWEAYLSWLESPCTETLIHPLIYDESLDALSTQFFSLAQESAPDGLKDQVNLWLGTLTEREREVIRLMFWENQTIRETAANLGMKKSTVMDLKKRVLCKLKNTPDTFPIMREQIPQNQEVSSDEKIMELASELFSEAEG